MPYPLSMPGSKHALVEATAAAIRRWGLPGSRIAVPCLGTAAAALGLRQALGVQIVHASDASPPILAVLRALRDRPAATVAAARSVAETVLSAATAEESSARFNAIRAELNAAVPDGLGRPSASTLNRIEAAVLEAAAPELGPVGAPAVLLALWRLSAQRIVRVAASTGRLNSPPRWSSRTPRPTLAATIPEAALHWLGTELRRSLPRPVFADVFDVLAEATPDLEGPLGGLDWIYVDPPYAGPWGAYTSERFDQCRLIQRVRDCRVPVVLHNAAGPIALASGEDALPWTAHFGVRPDGHRHVVAEEETLWRSGRARSRGSRPPVPEVLLLTRPGPGLGSRPRSGGVTGAPPDSVR